MDELKNQQVKEARMLIHSIQIPFTVSTQEITQFITRFSPIPMLKKHDLGYPIHIIMEKPTGKTMDCYVEFPSHEAAISCVRRFEYTAYPGRGTKLGTRNVNLDLSNQAELMEAIFPRARLVEFDVYTGQPHIVSQDHDHSGWSAGFRGYITLEEIYGITRFAECPSRSPFVLKCHQRVYESMITTLYKFPWAATKTYTIRARNALFESAWKQLGILSKKVGCPTGPASDANSMILHGYNGKGYPSNMNLLTSSSMEVRMNNREVGLSQSLLFDLLFAAVNVPAFNLLQKLALCQSAGSYGRGITLHPFSETWPFQTLEPVPETPDHIIKFWLELFDTGYDIMTLGNEPTGFEAYIIFTRNKIGFPIAEWTGRGIELSFEEATKVETAAMMCYVSRGREAWATEREIDVYKWKTNTLEEVMTQLAIEKHADRQVEATQVRTRSFVQPETTAVSPRTVGGLRNGSNEQQKRIDELGPIGDPSPKKGSRLNAATAMNFVPASVCGTNSSEGGVGLGTASSTSDLTDMWSRPFQSNVELNQTQAAFKHNTRSRQLRIDTNFADTTTTFKNPFSAPPERVNEERHHSIGISPFESSTDQVTPASAHPNSKHRSSIVLTGVSRPTPGQAQSRSQGHPATTDINKQMRSLSMASTVVRSPPQNLNNTATQDPNAHTQYPPSFSSGEEVTGGPVPDPFSPPQRERTHTVPDITTTNRGHEFGPIGSGYANASPNARSGSSSVAATVRSDQKTRAQSIPVVATSAAGTGYIRGEHGSEYGYGYGYGYGFGGRSSVDGAWGGFGAGRRFR